MADKIKTSDIIDRLSKQCNVSQKEATLFVESLQAIFNKALTNDKILKINNIGTFKSERTKPRKSIDVNTGESIEIPSHNRITFTPAVALANAVNADLAHLTTLDLDADNDSPEQSDNTCPDSTMQPSIADHQKINNETEPETIEMPTTNKTDIQNNGSDEPMTKLSEDALSIQQLLNEIQGLDSQTNNNDISDSSSNDKTEPETTSNNLNIVPDESETSKTHTDSDSKTEDTTQTPQKTESKATYTTIETANHQSSNAIVGAAAVAAINKENDRNIGGSQAVWISIAIILSLLIIAIIVWNNIDFFKKSSPTDQYTTTPTDTITSLPVDTYAHIDNIKTENNTTPDPQAADIDTIDTIDTQIPAPEITEQPQTTPPLPEPQDMSDANIYDTPRNYTKFIDTVTINEGSRLTLISQRKFGHKAFWVYIYEANRDIISNPNNIKSGTMLRIPHVNPRLIDPNNKQSIDYALELSRKYSQHN